MLLRFTGTLVIVLTALGLAGGWLDVEQSLVCVAVGLGVYAIGGRQQ